MVNFSRRSNVVICKSLPNRMTDKWAKYYATYKDKEKIEKGNSRSYIIKPLFLFKILLNEANISHAQNK